MKKVLALVLCFLLATTVFAACGTPASPATDTTQSGIGDAAEKTATDKLVIWSYMNEGEPVAIWQQSVVDKYAEMYPDVDVEIVFCGREILTQFQTKLNDKGATDFPDIVSQMSGTMIPLAEEGLFVSLDEAFATPALDQDMNWGDTFIPKLLESMQVDGANYFVPEGMYTHGFFYDEVMFEELGIKVPETWDELMDACEKLKAAGIAPVTLDGTTDVYNEWWFIRFATRLVGPEKIDQAARGEISFKEDPAFLKAAEYVATFSEKGYFQSGYEGSVFPAAQALFTQGKAGMLLCGAWIPTEMASQTPDTMKMRMFTLPELPDSVSPWHEEIWGNVFAVTKDAHNKENAINFLKVFSSMGVQNDKSAIKNPSPLIGGPAVTELSAIEEIVTRATSTSTTYSGLALYGDWFKNILGPLSTKLITGVMTPQEFINELDQQTGAYYAK